MNCPVCTAILITNAIVVHVLASCSISLIKGKQNASAKKVRLAQSRNDRDCLAHRAFNAYR